MYKLKLLKPRILVSFFLEVSKEGISRFKKKLSRFRETLSFDPILIAFSKPCLGFKLLEWLIRTSLHSGHTCMLRAPCKLPPNCDTSAFPRPPLAARRQDAFFPALLYTRPSFHPFSYKKTKNPLLLSFTTQSLLRSQLSAERKIIDR